MTDLFGALAVECREKPLASTQETLTFNTTPFENKIMISWEEGVVRAVSLECKRWNAVSRYGKDEFGKVKHPWEEFVCDVLGISSSYEAKRAYPHQKDRFKFYTEALGCRPTKFVEMWNACNCKAFIPSELREVANKFCRGYLGRFKPNYIYTITEHKDLMLELLDDDMENIIPFAISAIEGGYGKEDFSIKTFRKTVGKSVWKKLLNNSVHRNKLLCLSYSKSSTMRSTTLVELMEYPSGLLPNSVSGGLPSKLAIEVIKRDRVISDRHKVETYNTIINDSRRLLHQLPEVKYPRGWKKWSGSEWSEWHDHLSELVTLKRYSKDVIPWLQYYTPPTSKGYTAEILQSKYAIKIEGERMKHCVAGYGSDVEKGSYMVISIKDVTGNRYSTLGVRFNKITGFTLNQHYMACNKRVTDKEVLAYEKEIINSLNKQFKTTQENK